ncbi:MAG: multiheme c-type cytochrome [Planctomycetota bacterium]|nr:multiheme c-type cytochrome [Planctomycetota bacterium]
MRRLGLVAAALTLAACSDGEDAPRPVAAAVAVGEACLDCHDALVRSWRETGMARALEPLRPGELEGLDEVREHETGYRYRFEERKGGWWIVETREGGHRLADPIAFAIGAGNLDRSYAALRGGMLWFAPIEVVSATAKTARHAAPAPGNDITPGARMTTPITPECLGCHTDTPPPRGFPLNLAPDETWTPQGISCGACHGSVDAHVVWREAELTGADPAGEDPVLQPGRLGRVERLSICAACHLQGDARIVLDPGELGPPPPGGDLLEQRALFVAAEPTNDVGFVSQVERLVLSRCFLESEAMVCETCHDPHRSVYEESARRRVRDACLTCHTADHCTLMDDEARQGRDCASCHVRRTGVFDVARVEIHDHWIRVDPGPPGLLLMALHNGGHFERALALVDEAPGSAAARLPMYHHARGSLLERAGRLEEAGHSYEVALSLDPDLVESSINLGLLFYRLGRPKTGLRVLDDALARHPRAYGALRNRAVVRAAGGDGRGALADLRAAFEMLPQAEVAAAIASLQESLGEAAGAERMRRTAHELDPLRYP